MIIYKIGNFWNFRIWKFFGNFPNRKVSEFSKLQFFQIFQMENFFQFSKLKIFGVFQIRHFLEFPKSENFQIFRILQIVHFWSCPNPEIFRIFQFRNFWDSRSWKINEFLEFFKFRKPKFVFQKLAILELFVHSMFRITRNFANSHIFPLTWINFLNFYFLFQWLVSSAVLHLNVRWFSNSKRQPL